MQRTCKLVESFKRIQWTPLTMGICLSAAIFALGIIFSLTILANDTSAAIVATSDFCAKVGYDILKDGGSAVDAAIGTLLCQGVVLPSNSGIGGGFSAITYMGGRMRSLAATPTVPLGDDVYHDLIFALLHKRIELEKGVLTVGVPGEILGYWEMHKKYGLLPWARLFQPSIDLCEKGFKMSQWFQTILKSTRTGIFGDSDLQTRFAPDDDLSDGLNPNERITMKFPALANTLRKIALHGPDVFYKGEVGEALVADIMSHGGFLSMDDLANYSVSWSKALIRVRLTKDSTLYTTPLPTSGALVAFMLNVLKKIDPARPAMYWHFAAEAMKFAFGQRMDLGDADHEPTYRKLIMNSYHKLISTDFADYVRKRIKFDSILDRNTYYSKKYAPLFEGGSGGVAVISNRGDAVVATSSLSRHFGSFYISGTTGIIMNCLLNSFLQTRFQGMLIPPPNRIRSGKRSLVPHAPILVLHSKKSHVNVALTAIGGPRIPTLIVNAISKYIFMHKTADYAVNGINYHHQLHPNILQYDVEEPDKSVINYLNQCGHALQFKEVDYADDPGVGLIGYEHDKPDIAYTLRRDGSHNIHLAKEENLFLIAAVLLLIFGVLFIIAREVIRQGNVTQLARTMLANFGSVAIRPDVPEDTDFSEHS